MPLSLDNTKAIKILISQAKILKQNIDLTLYNTSTPEYSRFVSFKTYAQQYNVIAKSAQQVLGLGDNSFSIYFTDKMPSHMDIVWPIQKEIMESVALSTGNILTYLESVIEPDTNELNDIADFIKGRLRAAVFSIPQREIEVQNAIESLLIGRGMIKGIDYDRESGKFVFAGKEYIPDFIIPKINLCIEVKLLKKQGRKSRIIEEINADITAYSKEYAHQIFVVYDLRNKR